MGTEVKRFSIQVQGQIQGVGFRPWVFRLASEKQLVGFVRNDSTGVLIEVQGTSDNLQSFVDALSKGNGSPKLSRIAGIQLGQIPLYHENSFTISESSNSGSTKAEVTPDTAVCGECAAELKDSGNFRFHYPFINCTNCGPRYTIIRNIPYDRSATTMSCFSMCPRCATEYESPADRRFHAQPVACPACGPHLRLVDAEGLDVAQGDSESIYEACRLLAEGKVLAIKGIGGFHLAVDACNEEAVKELRRRKNRECKPFAMMARLSSIRQCAHVGPMAESLLSSPQSPIVLLSRKDGSPLAASIAAGTNTYGFMLPYAPLHHLLLDELEQGATVSILVMTSANIADQPLVYKNDEALTKLAGITDFFLMHDRDIYRQLDDSVIHLIGETAVPLRRARGYVPSPIYAQKPAACRILAAGSDLKNTFCLADGSRFIVSEHIGDLEEADIYRHYSRSIEHFSQLFCFVPSMVVADLHPGYFSTHYAESLRNIEVLHVQHHWAHIASVLAEHGHLGPVIGLAADGTGYGTDGKVWGCECLIASLETFERFAHLRYYPLAGGDKASKQAIRPLLALLDQAHGGKLELKDYGWLLERIEPDLAKQTILLQQLRKEVNTSMASSLGRVFDAVAAAIGLGSHNHFEAQLPIALEAIADAECKDAYEFTLCDGNPMQLDLSEMILAIVEDIRTGAAPSIISARFHNTIALAFLQMASKAREMSKLDVVAISGGVFCNRRLAARTIEILNNDGFEVLYNTVVPANDGGLSLGQAAIAAELSRSKRG
jgi:hydrogenase maturation protein HypF